MFKSCNSFPNFWIFRRYSHGISWWRNSSIYNVKPVGLKPPGPGRTEAPTRNGVEAWGGWDAGRHCIYCESWMYIQYLSYSIWSKIWNLYTNMSRYIHILCVSMCASRVWNVCFRFNPLAVVDLHTFSAATNSVQTQFGETFHQEGCQRLHSTLQKPQRVVAISLSSFGVCEHQTFFLTPYSEKISTTWGSSWITCTLLGSISRINALFPIISGRYVFVRFAFLHWGPYLGWSYYKVLQWNSSHWSL